MFGRTLASVDIADLFGDRAAIGAMLSFERELAQAQAAAGVVPASSAEAIARIAVLERPDPDVMVRDAAHAGSLAIPFVKWLRGRVETHDRDAARYVHFGATSQDLLDTALVLCTRDAFDRIRGHAQAAIGAAVSLARTHAGDAMTARTLLQPAGVMTAGLKAARWAASLQRSLERLDRSAREGLAVSLGGAVGDLAALGSAGPEVRRNLARRLGLADPGCAWHTSRERWCGLAADAGILAGSAGKIARDISLLCQAEIGEAVEPAAEGRGGSTAMPQKRNPVLSMRILAAVQGVPGRVAELLGSMVQEHERSLGAWQNEMAQVPELYGRVCTALEATATLLEGLRFDTARCRSNLDALQGTVMADRVTALLAGHLGHSEAAALAGRLSTEALSRKVSLGSLLTAAIQDDPRLAEVDGQDIETCLDPAEALRHAAAETQAVLASAGLA